MTRPPLKGVVAVGHASREFLLHHNPVDSPEGKLVGLFKKRPRSRHEHVPAPSDQEQCRAEMASLRPNGMRIVPIAHHESPVRDFCHSFARREGGRIVATGTFRAKTAHTRARPPTTRGLSWTSIFA